MAWASLGSLCHSGVFYNIRTCRASLLRMVGMIGENPPEISLWPNRSINLVVFIIIIIIKVPFFTVV
jgi:hypothetical protein